MPVLRFATEEDYQRFLATYQGSQKHTKARPGDTNGIQPSQTPTDGAKRLLQAILAAGLPGEWYREFTFHTERNWRLDVACPARKLCVEVDGMVHRIKKRFLGDIEKHNTLVLAGWRYLRVTPAQVDNGEALVLLTALIKGKP
jgi:very-short-patch-repair endonuclease